MSGRTGGAGRGDIWEPESTSQYGFKTAYPKEHAKHLCYMVARQGLLEGMDTDHIKSIVSPANFICADCGRVAAKAENLCNPKKR